MEFQPCFQFDRLIHQEAIECAKQDVLDCDGNIVQRNALVQKLIRLRIQEYVMMERTAGPLPDFERRGHALISWNEGKGNFPRVNAKRIYCQVSEGIPMPSFDEIEFDFAMAGACSCNL